MIIREYIHRYSRWDDSQKVDLRWESITDDLLEKFLKTGDVTMAMEWLLRQGHDFGSGGPVMRGLNTIAEQLIKKRQEILSQYNAAGIAEEIRRELDEIVGIERRLLDRIFNENELRYKSTGSPSDKRAMEDIFGKQAVIEALPKGLRGALEYLKDYEWTDAGAGERFRKLADSIRRIQDAISRNWFTGTERMSLDRTVETVRQLKELNELIDAIRQGRLYDLDLDSLATALGEEARQSIEMMLQFMDFLIKEGFLRQTEDDIELGARAAKRIAQKALKDIYTSLKVDSFGSHDADRAGVGEPLQGSLKEYEYGDALIIDLKATMFESMARKGACGTPISIEPTDLMVASTEKRTTAATALLLDMSLSMVREGRFGAAKKVAMALENMVRTRYPRDKFFTIGFATVARELKGTQLANARGAGGGDIFTNIQDALRLAAKLLGDYGTPCKQIILVTDGQPTAYSLGGELHVEWPMFGVSPNAERETLKEVSRVTHGGVTINTFMLDASPELMNFVDKMTRINKGRAFYTTPDNLGQYLLVDFVKRRRRVLN